MENYTILTTGMIFRESDGAYIPQDVTNIDYVRFLEWKDAGNVPTVEQEPEAPPEPSRDQQLADAMAQLQALQAQIQALMNQK